MKYSSKNEMATRLKIARRVLIASIVVAITGGTLTAQAATPTPLDGLVLLKKIPIPTWTTVGAATQASTDVWSFDPSTNTLYFADRVNKGVSAIDTTTNTYLGTLKVPTCNDPALRPGSCPSGVLVAPDLHKLVVTDRNTVVAATGVTINLKSIFIFDLRLQSTTPIKIDLPLGTNTDELDYDPLNHRAYVGNTGAPFFVTVVDVLNNTLVGQIPLPGNPEQPRFNPTDGMIYATVPADDPASAQPNKPVIVRIDPTAADNNGAGKIIATLATPGCASRAIDIDAITDNAFVGCAAPGAQLLVDLSGSMSIVNTFPGVTGTDTGQFNANVRRFYSASSNNDPALTVCPGNAATPSVAPVVGVFSAPTKKQPKGALVGADCSGTNGHDIGVDPVHNQVFVGVRQGPVALDPTFPANLANGNPGVLVWHDPAPLTQPDIIEQSNASLKPLNGQTARGTVHIEDSHLVRADINKLSGAQTALINITTTIGNEVVNCDLTGSGAECAGLLKGEALIGGTALLSVNGKPAAKGTIGPGNGGDGGDNDNQGHDD